MESAVVSTPAKYPARQRAHLARAKYNMHTNQGKEDIRNGSLVKTANEKKSPDP
jgi:hypothetical protein